MLFQVFFRFMDYINIIKAQTLMPIKLRLQKRKTQENSYVISETLLFVSETVFFNRDINLFLIPTIEIVY